LYFVVDFVIWQSGNFVISTQLVSNCKITQLQNYKISSARYFGGWDIAFRRLTLLFESLYTQACGASVAAEQLPPDSAAAAALER
jgi:hypothetical protein